MDIDLSHWRKCSSCKKEIGYRQKYYVCSVSTCTRKRTGLVFCSVVCFERHLPSAKHRSAYAIEEHSPSLEQWKAEVSTFSPPPPSTLSSSTNSGSLEKNFHPKKIIPHSSPSLNKIREEEILVVASKVKDYIRRHSDMNTSSEVFQFLSHRIRKMCDEAMQSAHSSGRKTVMERDFKN